MAESKVNKLDRLVVIVLLLMGAGVRFVGYGQLPPGLYHDEALNGLDALGVREGEFPLYFKANNGREPMFIYLVALSVGIFGRSPIAVRLPSFFTGFLTLAATYNLTRVLYNRKTARYALAVLAFTFWHIHLSRVAFRSSLLPLFTALYLSAIVKAIKYHKRIYWIIGGVLYGLSWYTYIAARFTPVALAVLCLYALGTRRLWSHSFSSRQIWHALTAFTLSALIVLLPLGIFTLIHPDVVLTRSSQVSIFNEQINGGDIGGTFIRHTLNSVGMFIIRGDRIWRHNLSYRPVWTAGLGVAFVCGLGVALAGFRKHPAAALPLIWTSVMLLPTLLAEDAPHFLRAVGVLPTAALLPALGLSWLQSRVSQWIFFRNARQQKPLHQMLLSRGIPWLLVVSSGLLSIYSYFVTYAQSPLVYHWFESGPVEMAQEINTLNGRGWDGQTVLKRNTDNKTVCIDPIFWESWSAIPFLVPQEDICFLPVISPQPNQGITFVVWPYNDWRKTIGQNLHHPSYLSITQGPTAQGDLDPEPFTLAHFIHADPIPPLPPIISQFENGLELHAVLVEPQIGGVMVNLYWRTSIAQTFPSTVFVHYLRDDNRIAQNDGQPGNDQLPTTFWVPGDLILDRHYLADITPDTTSDRLRIGIYHSNTGENIPRVIDNLPAEPWYETTIILVP